MPRWRYGIMVCVAAIVVAGCASVTGGSYVERGGGVTQYRTYAWGPDDVSATGDPRLDNNPFFQNSVRASIDSALAPKGFEKVVSSSPDLLVHYHFSVSQRIDVNAVDQKYGYCGACVPYVVDAGTFTVDIVDRRTETLLWRGWAEENLDGVIDNQRTLDRTVVAVVGRILKRFPAER